MTDRALGPAVSAHREGEARGGQRPAVAMATMVMMAKIAAAMPRGFDGLAQQENGGASATCSNYGGHQHKGHHHIDGGGDGAAR